MSKPARRVPDTGRPFGGQYAPESLMDSLQDLQDAFERYWSDLDFRQEFETHLALMRPPTQLQLARKLTKFVGGARIYLKREDMNFTGNHSITNALGQALLARRLGKSTILAETGSGGHGIATAAVCQKLGLECIIYMGSRDAQARPQHVNRIKLYGAQVIEVTEGQGTIREATTAVLRAAVEKYETAYPLLGGSYGPRPLPTIANTFQSHTGTETKRQMLSMTSRLPDAVVSCAGIHSPGVGLFDPFIQESNVRLVAVEGAGCGLNTDLHAAVLTQGTPGVYHGSHTLVLQDSCGQIEKVHSIAPDLCYPSVSPSISKWTYDGRVEPIAVADDEAVIGCAILSKVEGIDCSIEDGHALAAGLELASTMSEDKNVIVCIGGGA